LHDVGAHDPGAVERMLGCIPPEAHAHAVLLVVPNWRGMAAWAPGTLARALARFGAPVLHGYTHSLGPSLIGRLWTGTEREGEFAQLSEREARARLAVALKQVAFESPSPLHWFCPPRWQASEGTRRAVRRAGLGLMQRDTLDLPDGRRIVAPALWFDDGTRWLPNAIGALQRALRVARWLPSVHALRIALHPRDVPRLAARRAIDRVFEACLRDGWRAASLDELAGAS
jgi:predicted deacetylase